MVFAGDSRLADSGESLASLGIVFAGVCKLRAKAMLDWEGWGIYSIWAGWTGWAGFAGVIH